jgi:hypothetical protein
MNYPRHFGYCLSLFLFCIQKENRKIENLFFFSGDDDGQWKSKAAPTLENTFLRIHFACRMYFYFLHPSVNFQKNLFLFCRGDLIKKERRRPGDVDALGARARARAKFKILIKDKNKKVVGGGGWDDDASVS